MNIITRTGKVQCGPSTKLVVTVEGNAWLLSFALLVLWLAGPSASLSLDLAALGFCRSGELL